MTSDKVEIAPGVFRKQRGSREGGALRDYRDYVEARRMRDGGATYTEIAERFDVSGTRAQQMVKRAIRKGFE